MEGAAIIDVCRALGILDASATRRGKILLVRIVSRLTKLRR